MIQMITSLEQLDFSKLTHLYKTDIDHCRQMYYPYMDLHEGRICAEQDLYCYLRDCFFAESNGRYFINIDQDRYVSGIRLESYRDAELLNALVTDEDFRRKGYASALLKYALSVCVNPVYSHVSIKNVPSMRFHQKLGFKKLLDYAVMLDGTVRSDHVTYIWTP